MDAPGVDGWIAEVRGADVDARIGMLLTHVGVVRGTSRDGTPVSSMTLSVDRGLLDSVLAEASAMQGVIAVRAWVNEGELGIGDNIMRVLVAGDIRPHVFEALQHLVGRIKSEVVTETESR